MAPRPFRMPRIEELSKEQDRALDLPSKGQYLIIGGPGTGKSVLALLRARRHQRAREDYVFLVWNHTLNHASRQLFDGELRSQTWERWFGQQFNSIVGKPAPRLAPSSPGGYPPFDWDETVKVSNSYRPSQAPQRPFLVIDEGQDMPPQFYETLLNLRFENFFVVADQNQQMLHKRNSRREEIGDRLVIGPDDVIELKQNYRNPHPVARLARHFFTGDRASPPPELPEPKPHQAKPILFEYGSTGTVARRILNRSENHGARLIGVITARDATRTRFVNRLRSIGAAMGSRVPPIQTYSSNDRSQIDFGKGGIVVVNVQSCKGLEFDLAILADIDEHYFRVDRPDPTRRRFYVMTARARENVFLLRRKGASAVDPILPEDHGILDRDYESMTG